MYKLLHPGRDEPGLTLVQADEDVVLYRCFLKLCALVPDLSLVPTEAIDRVWHAHLLDTAKYRADCRYALGRFVDHFPYAGLRGDADEITWHADFARTRQLFAKHFGVELGDTPTASVCHLHDNGSDCCVGEGTQVTEPSRAGKAGESARARSGGGVRPRPARSDAPSITSTRARS